MKKLFYTFALMLLLFRKVTALLSQSTIYDYNNRTLYIYLQNKDSMDLNYYGNSLNKIFKIPFDSKYSSGDIINSTIASPPNDSCNIMVIISKLYALCPSSNNNENNNLQVNEYVPNSNSWSNIHLNSSIQYFDDSTYLFTDSDTTGIYIFSGLTQSANNSISNRMIRLDTLSWTISNATSQVQPSPFYKSTTLKINSNTQALFGGITSNDNMVSMNEIPVWQYNSWAERPVNISSNIKIEERVNSLVLPVFSDSNDYSYNQTLTNFEVSSVFMMGGINNNKTYANPKFASLNVSTNIWEWNDLSNNLLIANNNNTEILSLDSIIAAGMIYDTLITISNSTSTTNSLNKRSIDTDYYKIQLYNSSSLLSIDSIDYTYKNKPPTVIIVSHSSKNLTIALSVIIPILVIIILTCFGIWLYKRYKNKKEEERNEKEIREIVDFYEHQHKQLSQQTFSSYDSDYKSAGSDYDFENINYTDNDDVSLNSWRKKRQEFEQQKIIYNAIKPRINSFSNNPGGSIRRSLSVASDFISHSLKRNSSTQSSIATFVTARSTINNDEKSINDDTSKNKSGELDDTASSYYENTTNENPFQNDLYTIHSNSSDTLTLTRPPPAVPKHSTLATFPNRTSSTLNHIPEDASVSTFHSQSLGFIPVKQTNPYSPQQNYMKHITQSSSDSSTSSLMNSSSIYSKSTRRPLSMKSSSTVSSNRTNIKTISHSSASNSESDKNINKVYHYDDTGSISEEELNNYEVQVLVGSKRRSKLRVVNPDEKADNKDDNDENKDDKGDIDRSFINESIIDEKPRCSSSSSEQSSDTNVRKRVISDEKKNDEHNESFL